MAADSRLRHRFREIAACLILGLTVTVLVAWACAARLNPDVMKGQPALASDMGRFGRDVLERLRAQSPQPASDDEILVTVERVGGATRRAAFVIPYWQATTDITIFRSVSVSTSLPALTLHVRAGWPCECLEGVRIGEAVARTSNVQDLDRSGVIGFRFAGDGEERLLPLRPLGFGFTVNTLLFAMIAWLLLFAPFAIRRARRRRRGLCERCAYPRGESDRCSECGTALPPLPSPS